MDSAVDLLFTPDPAEYNTNLELKCRMQLSELPEDPHMTQIYNTCMTKHSYLQLHTSQTRQRAQHPSHLLHTCTTNPTRPSRLKKPRPFTIYYKHSHRSTHRHYNGDTNKHVPYTQIQCF